jgi:ABC-type protease/lipase transport system fused ATPase/permease subunit
MSRPRIWLLDEPTASLDGEAETRVWKALQARLQPEDILIVATHRPMAPLILLPACLSYRKVLSYVMVLLTRCCQD